MTTSCCGILEQLKDKYDLPFDLPFSLNVQDGRFEQNGWALRLLKLTPSGAISKKGNANIYLNYCPFCGAQLRAEEESDDDN